MNIIYTVKITQNAQKQMKEILYYISKKLQAPDAAENLLEEMKKAIFSLRWMPQRIAFTKESKWCEQGVRRMPVKNYYIYFWIDEENSIVQIVAVIYQKREQKYQIFEFEKE